VEWKTRFFLFSLSKARKGNFLCINKYNMYRKTKLILKENEDVTHLNYNTHKVPVVAQIETA